MPGVRRRLFWPGMTPQLPQLADLKTAVSEAVTNCIVHAYPDKVGPVTMTIAVYPDREVRIRWRIKGVGIPDIHKAMEPLYTTGNPEETLHGLGFAVMQSFMDKVTVRSRPGHGPEWCWSSICPSGKRQIHIKEKRGGKAWYRIQHSAVPLLSRTWGWSTPVPDDSGAVA